MMTLDGCGWSTFRTDALNHIRIQSTLCKKINTLRLFGLAFKNFNEKLTNGFSFYFGIGDSRVGESADVGPANGPPPLALSGT